MNEEKYTYLEPVTNGAKLLTEHFGDESWKGRIDPDTLVMSNTCKCVLGQLFGNFYDGVEKLGFPDDANTSAWGFDITLGDGRYDDLQATWRRYLTEGKE